METQDNRIRKPRPDELPRLAAWLAEEKLVDDSLDTLDLLQVLERQGEIAAMAGVECHGDYGILRSVLVRPAFRGQGLAQALVKRLHAQSEQQGLRHLYLITEHAAGFFERLGYARLPLEETPEAVQAFRRQQCRCAPCAVAMHYSLTAH